MTADALQDLIVAVDSASVETRCLIAALTLVGCADIARDYREGAIASLLRPTAPTATEANTITPSLTPSLTPPERRFVRCALLAHLDVAPADVALTVEEIYALKMWIVLADGPEVARIVRRAIDRATPRKD